MPSGAGSASAAGHRAGTVPSNKSTAVRHNRSRRLNRELITTYAIVAVLMAYFALRHFYPTLFAFFVSFNKYDLLTGAFSFVGIDKLHRHLHRPALVAFHSQHVDLRGGQRGLETLC